MPHRSRWTIETPAVSLPTFIFGPAGEASNATQDEKRVFVDAERPDTHWLTLTSFRDWSQRFAAGLVAAGLEPGDRVMLFSGNSFFTPIVVMGTIMAGGIYNSANPGYKSRELSHQVKNCEPRFILAAPKGFKKAQEVALHNGLVASQVLLFEDLTNLEVLPSQSRDTRTTWTKLIASPEAGQRFRWSSQEKERQDSPTAIIAYSSGTTGLPKGVEVSHYQIVSNMLQLSLSLCSDKTIITRRALAVLPFYHGLGLMYNCLVAPKLGIEVYLVKRYNLKTMLQHIQRFKTTELLLVPTIVRAIAKSPEARNGMYDLSSVRKVVTAAAPLSHEASELFEQIWGGRVRVRQVWGMTESPALTIAWDEIEDANSTSTCVGELLANVEAKLINDDESEVIELESPGELCLRGPNTMTSYWRNPEATAATFTKDGWLRTGDVARVDSKGKWYIVDRKKELIKVRGAQVAPSEREALLMEHPQVLDAAVVGVPTAEGDEEPRAYVVARHGEAVTEEDIQEFVSKRVSKQKRLSGGVVFVDALPKTLTGKVVRRELRERAARERRARQSHL